MGVFLWFVDVFVDVKKYAVNHATKGFKAHLATSTKWNFYNRRIK